MSNKLGQLVTLEGIGIDPDDPFGPSLDHPSGSNPNFTDRLYDEDE